MLVESLIKATVDLQGFRVASVQGGKKGMIAELAIDRRYAPRSRRSSVIPVGFACFAMCHCGHPDEAELPGA